MSAFGGKNGHPPNITECPLMTQSRHERLKFAALQTDPGTPFRRLQNPAVIAFHSA